MLKKTILLFFLLSSFVTTVSAQSAKQKLSRAKDFFYHEKYSDALAVLSSSRQLSRNNKEGRFLIAVCHYQLNQLDFALELLNEIAEERKTPYPECWLYTAKVYHAMHKFNEAAKYYKLYLRTIRPEHKHRQMAREEIRRCANGINVQFRQALAIVENLGSKVNTEEDEFAPVPSRNRANKLYFSSMRYGNIGGPRNTSNQKDEQFGTYLSDMFSCGVVKGQWTNVERMHFLLNSPQHERLLDFNNDGSILYYYKGWKINQGEVVVDTFKTFQNRKLNSTPFIGPEGLTGEAVSLCLYNDTLLIFSSRRGGGFGGKDLYKSVYKSGRWSRPENLGETINTVYDETSPYLSPDGKTLYFSSNDSRKSIGGYDIFRSVFIQKTQHWSSPLNLGIPINSASDDTGFRLTRDGFTAFFDSSRKDGFGKRDLYIAYFQEYLDEVEAPLIAYSTTEPVPQPEVVESVFEEEIFEEPAFSEVPPPVIDTETSTKIPPFVPLYFESNNGLDIHQKNALNPIVDLLNEHSALTLIITAYTNKKEAVPERLFESIMLAERAAEYLQSKGVAPTSIYMRALDGSQSTIQKAFALDFAFIGMGETSMQEKVPVIGDYYTSVIPNLITNEALSYKIQISSVLKVLKKKQLNNQPYPMIEKTPDFKYYRYTLGAFENFSEAKIFSKKMRSLGLKGAYVVPFINGKRADKNEAKRSLGIFPDLENYLKG